MCLITARSRIPEYLDLNLIQSNFNQCIFLHNNQFTGLVLLIFSVTCRIEMRLAVIITWMVLVYFLPFKIQMVLVSDNR